MLPEPALRAHLAMLLFSLLVAGSHSLGGKIATLVDPFALMAVRFGLAGMLIGLLAVTTTRFKTSYFHSPWRYLVLGILLVIFFAFMFIALRTISPLTTSAIFTLIPFISTLFGAIILKQNPSPKVMLALSLGAIGSLWIIFHGQLSLLLEFNIGQGEIIFFLGCVAYALYAPLAQKLDRGEPTIFTTVVTTFCGFCILTILGWKEITVTDWANLPIILWIGLAYISVGATAITFLLLQYASVNLDSLNVMSYTFLTPGWVILWEFALTGSLPDTLTLIGVGITIAAMASLYILSRNKQRI